MFQMRSVLAAALAAAGLGCAPAPEGPVQVMALVRSEGSSGSYQPAQVTLGTLSDAVALEGSVARLIGGAQIVDDSSDPLLKLNQGRLTEEQHANILLKGKGRPPRASYVEKDGVLWPADFHTWNLVTTYYNFEKAFEHFQAVGVPAASLGQVPVYYFPSFIHRDVSHEPWVDNVLYAAVLKSFLVLPFDQLQATPLSINQGIVAHEYSHLVWFRLVFGGAARPVVLEQWAQRAAMQTNLLKSLDEGLADFHAFVASCRSGAGLPDARCDSRFMGASYGGLATDARDLSRPDKCLTAGLRNSLGTQGVGVFLGAGLHYQVGTALAAALYQAGEDFEDWKQLSRSVVEAYPRLGEVVQGNLETPQYFGLETALDVLLEHVTSPDLKTRLCGQFLGRLGAQRELLTHCPAQAAPSAGCEGM